MIHSCPASWFFIIDKLHSKHLRSPEIPEMIRHWQQMVWWLRGAVSMTLVPLLIHLTNEFYNFLSFCVGWNNSLLPTRDTGRLLLWVKYFFYFFYLSFLEVENLTGETYLKGFKHQISYQPTYFFKMSFIWKPQMCVCVCILRSQSLVV